MPQKCKGVGVRWVIRKGLLELRDLGTSLETAVQAMFRDRIFI